MSNRSFGRGLALGLLFGGGTAAIAASAPTPTFGSVTLPGGTLSGIASASDAAAGTSAGLAITPATLKSGQTALLQALPTTMPTTVGALWNNGGIISTVQP